MLARGDRVVVDVGPAAHGGHCVARHEGQVLFVRHALPGERVEAVVTDVGRKNRFVRADAVAVLEPSPDRVEPPCPHARPGGCGGCDWQHASLPAQRALKAAVLREQLERLGGISEIGGVPLAESVDVVAVPGDHDGLGWRTRVRFAVGPGGRAGFHGHRSHAVHPVDPCPLTTQELQDIRATALDWEGTDALEVVASSGGDRTVVVEPSRIGRGLPREVNVPGLRGRGWVRELAAGREWRVAADGFWQVHPGAADTLVAAVRAALDPRPGERLLDLYCGVGLFAGALAADLGPDGAIDAVEASTRACADARRNLHDLPNVRIHAAPVERWLASPSAPDESDLVVLDPPRSGAGVEVIDALLDRAPRAIAYVACDPAALGRDLGHAARAGWRVASVQGFDLFPMTHHLEAVALLLPPSR
ncbi:MAG: class I SAM-dependent RNA methyltransferase [Candidatus Nanopelagicales bacterium]